MKKYFIVVFWKALEIIYKNNVIKNWKFHLKKFKIILPCPWQRHRRSNQWYHFFSERLRFFREKPLKLNFDGIRIWEIFSIKRILKRAEKIIIRWRKRSGLYEECSKTSQENLSTFSLVRKDVCGRMLSWWKVSPPVDQFWEFVKWPLSNNQVARSIWRHRWFGSLWKLIINHSLDTPDAQHHFLRVKSGFSNLEASILQSPGHLGLTWMCNIHPIGYALSVVGF